MFWIFSVCELEVFSFLNDNIGVVFCRIVYVVIKILVIICLGVVVKFCVWFKEEEYFIRILLYVLGI